MAHPCGGLFVCTGYLLLSGFAEAERIDMATDVWPTENWSVSSLEEQSIDPVILAQGLENTADQRKPTSSFLIVRHGVLLWEAYGDGYDQNSKHYSASMTKSVLSAVVGIAIDQGYIKSVEQSIAELIGDDDFRDLHDVQLKHLLTMCSGYGVKNIYKSPKNPTASVVITPESTPGTTFAYNDDLAHLTSKIVTAVSGRSVLELAEEFLFEPIGVTSYIWPADEQGITIGHTALEWTARDMARFGYLYLRNGRWGEQQVVTEDWVRESTQKYSEGGFPANHAYGYFWWVEKNTKYNIFFAGGFGEQRIFVIPELDMVIVVTVDVDRGMGGHFYLEEVVLPAVIA